MKPYRRPRTRQQFVADEVLLELRGVYGHIRGRVRSLPTDRDMLPIRGRRKGGDIE